MHDRYDKLNDLAKDKACEQFLRRCKYAVSIEKVDNSNLYAGSPMYFYCKDCGVPTEVLPEDYLFPPFNRCSQCQGLQQHNWLELAKAMAKEQE